MRIKRKTFNKKLTLVRNSSYAPNYTKYTYLGSIGYVVIDQYNFKDVSKSIHYADAVVTNYLINVEKWEIYD